MIIAGMSLLLVVGIFRFETDITWGLVVSAFFLLALCLIAVGLALTYKGA